MISKEKMTFLLNTPIEEIKMEELNAEERHFVRRFITHEHASLEERRESLKNAPEWFKKNIKL